MVVLRQPRICDLIGWKTDKYDDLRRIRAWVLLPYCHGIRIILDGVVGVDCLID